MISLGSQRVWMDAESNVFWIRRIKTAGKKYKRTSKSQLHRQNTKHGAEIKINGCLFECTFAIKIQKANPVKENNFLI
jgi:hypothetical protein